MSVLSASSALRRESYSQCCAATARRSSQSSTFPCWPGRTPRDLVGESERLANRSASCQKLAAPPPPKKTAAAQPSRGSMSEPAGMRDPGFEPRWDRSHQRVIPTVGIWRTIMRPLPFVLALYDGELYTTVAGNPGHDFLTRRVATYIERFPPGKRSATFYRAVKGRVDTRQRFAFPTEYG